MAGMNTPKTVTAVRELPVQISFVCVCEQPRFWIDFLVKHPLPLLNCGNCGRNETCCSDGRCFPRAYECDRETDCVTDRGDENSCTCGESAQPEIENPLVEVTKPVRKGDTVELRCRVRGKERPTVNWRFNWGHLPDDVRFIESMSVEEVRAEKALKIQLCSQNFCLLLTDLSCRKSRRCRNVHRWRKTSDQKCGP